MWKLWIKWAAWERSGSYRRDFGYGYGFGAGLGVSGLQHGCVALSVVSKSSSTKSRLSVLGGEETTRYPNVNG